MTRLLTAGIAAGLFTSLLTTSGAEASSCCDLLFAANKSEPRQTTSMTVLVEGMMKSRSGAT